MVVAVKVETMDYVEAVKFLADECRKEGKPPSEILTPAHYEMLSDEACQKLALMGWGYAASGMHHSERMGVARSSDILGGKNASVRLASHPADGRNPGADILGILWSGSEGELKELIDFCEPDLESLHVEAEGKAAGWSRKEDWAAKALAELKKRPRAQCVGDLPGVVLSELRDMAVKAWR